MPLPKAARYAPRSSCSAGSACCCTSPGGGASTAGAGGVWRPRGTTCGWTTPAARAPGPVAGGTRGASERRPAPGRTARRRASRSRRSGPVEGCKGAGEWSANGRRLSRRASGRPRGSATGFGDATSGTGPREEARPHGRVLGTALCFHREPSGRTSHQPSLLAKPCACSQWPPRALVAGQAEWLRPQSLASPITVACLTRSPTPSDATETQTCPLSLCCPRPARAPASPPPMQMLSAGSMYVVCDAENAGKEAGRNTAEHANR